jgi:hypothetical protein
VSVSQGHRVSGKEPNIIPIAEHFGFLVEVIGGQNVIVCKEHIGVIPVDHLSTHLITKHRSQCSLWLRKPLGINEVAAANAAVLEKHIVKALAVNPKQCLQDLLGLELSRPFKYGFPQPQRCVRCPSCHLWFRYCEVKNRPFKYLREHLYRSTSAESQICKEAWMACPVNDDKRILF